MRRQALIFIVLALAAGGLAALLAARMLRTPPTSAGSEGVPAVSVVVANRDMNVGTLIQQEDIRMVDWPAGQVPVGYPTSAAEVVGRGLLTPVRTNEPLLAGKLANPELGGGMHIMIPEGMRAMSVRVDDVVGVAGFVLPGTRVDVVVTMDQANVLTEAATRVVLQNIEVISAGQSIERNPQGEPVQVPVVTLLVDPEQAEELAMAHTNGRLQLALRSPMDLDSVGTRGLSASQLIAGRPQQAAPVVSSAPRPAAAPAPPPAPATVQLEIIRGPERSTSTVDTTLGGGGGP
jgi:pilus assembly protein CpaB